MTKGYTHLLVAGPPHTATFTCENNTGNAVSDALGACGSEHAGKQLHRLAAAASVACTGSLPLTMLTLPHDQPAKQQARPGTAQRSSWSICLSITSPVPATHLWCRL